MRILLWNCRGAGKAPTVRAIKALARGEGPDVLFLSETKVKSPRIEKLRSSMSFFYSHCVDCVGKTGGLVLFWKAGIELEVVFENKYVMASLIYSDPPDTTWLLLTIHGPPY
jgi:exonuclease III